MLVTLPAPSSPPRGVVHRLGDFPDGPLWLLRPGLEDSPPPGLSGLVVLAPVIEDHASPSAWLPAGRRRFEHWAAAWTAAAGPTLTPCLWPDSHMPVGDIPSLAAFLRTHARAGAGSWRFLFDPMALLTPAMGPNAQDHLARIFQHFAPHPDAIGIVLADRDGEWATVGLSAGGRFTAMLLAEHRRSNPPGAVFLHEPGVREQAAMIVPAC